MLTERELVETAEGSRVYKSVGMFSMWFIKIFLLNYNFYQNIITGRMFVLRSKDSLIEEQKKRQTTCEEEVKKALSLLETQKKKLGEANEDFNKLYISFTEDLKKK